MKILYIYRHPKSGFSITKVIQTLANKIGEYHAIDRVFLPYAGAGPLDIFKNILYVRKMNRSNVYHISGDVHYLAYVLPKAKTLITVHDIMYYSYLKGLKKIIWKYLYIYPLKRAGQLVFISDFARQQVEKVISIDVRKATVIPNGLGNEFSYSPREFNSDKPVILHIGTLARKNLSRTIIALRDISCHLRIIGKINTQTKELLREYNIEYSHIENLTNEEIIEEYKNCDIVNFPSTFEGFGMPIIEGQGIGRPVVTSNLSPMKEVAGVDAAYLVDPYNVESLKDTYREIIENQNLREQHILQGVINSNKYRVDKIAQQYISIYKKMI